MLKNGWAEEELNNIILVETLLCQGSHGTWKPWKTWNLFFHFPGLE